MLKKKDLIFLAHLRENSRASLTKISKKTNIPVSTLFDRLKSQRGNLIKKYTTIIDFEKMGYNCRAKVILKLGKECRENAKSFLVRHQNVNSVYRINNGYDFMVEVIFSHVKEMEEFLEVLDTKFNVVEKNVYFVIDEIQRENFLSRPEDVDEWLANNKLLARENEIA
ncbi:MAG: Lrp/AsnC family transcriptional regulator [Candidatus Woesearchaeota archaeon]